MPDFLAKKKITVLGSTGSVGRSTLDLIHSQSAHFELYAVTAHNNVEELAKQALAGKAKKAVIANEDKFSELKALLSGSGIEVAAGGSALNETAAEPVDLVMGAIVGVAGLNPVLSALEKGINVAIANKEPLVAAGPLVVEMAKRTGARLLPVDSEHNAVFQVFEDKNRAAIKKIILTASGGPFRTWDKERMANATVEEAVAHPNWRMGAKISVDSASMMNKALELIEARYLFDMPAGQIDILVHPQSIIHSMVEYIDGSVLAQLGAPDMRTPIAHALAWPSRVQTSGQTLNWAELNQLTFEKPDTDKFPVLDWAYECLQNGEGACIDLNAANEVAVSAFLNKRIAFSDIYKLIEKTLQNSVSSPISSLDDIVDRDRAARERAESCIKPI